MAKEIIDLRKEVFSKAQYVRTIDTSFSELGVTSIGDDLIAQPNVEEFFDQYSELFYDIPPNGEINSHEYLASESGAYAGADSINAEVQVLLDEIAELRRENLELRSTDLNNQLADAGIDETISFTQGDSASNINN